MAAQCWAGGRVPLSSSSPSERVQPQLCPTCPGSPGSGVFAVACSGWDPARCESLWLVLASNSSSLWTL